MTPTEQYISTLTHLKAGAMALLRRHAMQRLDQSVDGFDLFAGLWWPLRQRRENTPRREVAWLVAKLYALNPIPPEKGASLPRRLRRCVPSGEGEAARFRERFDRLLISPLERVEPELRWALAQLAAKGSSVDWVALTNQLSLWERQSTRRNWAKEFLGISEGE